MNKKGEGYISVCVLIIILCMILSVLTEAVAAVNVVKMTERNARVVLDNFVMVNAIEIFDSIKNGNDDTESIDAQEYIDALAEFCTFEKSGGYMYALDSEKNEMYRISVPTVGFEDMNKLKIYSSFTLYYPLYFFGVHVTTAQIPVTVISKYTEKF